MYQCLNISTAPQHRVGAIETQALQTNTGVYIHVSCGGVFVENVAPPPVPTSLAVSPSDSTAGGTLRKKDKDKKGKDKGKKKLTKADIGAPSNFQ